MIRYDKKLNTELSNIVRKYNSKITRLARKGIDTPERISVKNIKTSFTNRRDLNYYIKDLNEFIKRDATKMVRYRNQVMNKYQASIIKRNRRRLASQIAYKRRAAMKTYIKTLGRPSSLSMAEEFDMDYLRLEALEERFLNEDIEDVSKFIDYLQKNVKHHNLSRWQQNYSDMILDVAYTYGIPHDKIHEFRERLLSLSAKDFDRLIKNERSLQSIIYYYQQINDVGVDIAYDAMENEVVSLFNAIFEEENSILKGYESIKSKT